MIPGIDTVKTGEQIRRYISLRGLSVMEVKEYLSLGCVQSVYHWLSGKSLPSTDNLYALSILLQVPMDELVVGKTYGPSFYGQPDKRNYLKNYYSRLHKGSAA